MVRLKIIHTVFKQNEPRICVFRQKISRFNQVFSWHNSEFKGSSDKLILQLIHLAINRPCNESIYDESTLRWIDLATNWLYDELTLRCIDRRWIDRAMIWPYDESTRYESTLRWIDLQWIDPAMNQPYNESTHEESTLNESTLNESTRNESTLQ
jgi:hypothetical protein